MSHLAFHTGQMSLSVEALVVRPHQMVATAAMCQAQACLQVQQGAVLLVFHQQAHEEVCQLQHNAETSLSVSCMVTP